MNTLTGFSRNSLYSTVYSLTWNLLFGTSFHLIGVVINIGPDLFHTLLVHSKLHAAFICVLSYRCKV